MNLIITKKNHEFTFLLFDFFFLSKENIIIYLRVGRVKRRFKIVRKIILIYGNNLLSFVLAKHAWKESLNLWEKKQKQIWCARNFAI